ncbi:MAG: hypothetical protein ACEPOZ_01380 [Marinifilaceae bacterium]
MKKILTLIVLGMLIFSNGYSQKKLWEVDLREALYEVGWIKQSNDGYIIAAGAKGLLAMDNETGEIRWHNKELKAIDKNTFMNIDGLPIFYVEYAPVVGKVRGLLINSSNGKVLYDTKDDGVRIKDFTMYPEWGNILFEVMKGDERKVLCFSLRNWEKTWIADLGEAKSMIKKFSRRTFVDHGPIFNKDNNLIIGVKDQIFAVNSTNGEILWKYQANKKINALVFSEINNSLYVGVKKSKKLKVLDPASGKDITPGKLKLKGTLIDVRPDNDNNLILVETEGFNIINPKTNDFKWKRSFKIDYLEEVIAHEKGFIAIGKNEKQGSICLVNQDGKKDWESKVKGYSYYVTPTDKGVLYISTERSNILDYEKGKDVWKRDVKFKAIPAVTYDEKEDKIILFENKKGYKFDLKTGHIDLFAEDVELEHVKRKTPLLAEYVDGAGYLLNTGQHLSLLTPSGEVKYTKYYEPASDLEGFKHLAQIGLFIAGVDFDIDGNLANIKMLSSLSNGAYRTSFDQTDGTSEASVVAGLYLGTTDGGMAPIFEITKRRYSNSKSIKDHRFVVTKINEKGAPIKHFIYKVNKKTGETDVEIELKDKTPNYLIDEVDNVVVINEKNHLISTYKF